ncbi:MAG: ATPase, T2SS/T4P/T4SS family [Gammaproteobacteria bacterium]
MRIDTVMKVVKVDSSPQEQSPAVRTRLDLQPPPFAELMDGPDYTNCLIAVEIHRNQRIKGKLCRFDADAEMLEILETSKSKPTSLAFSDIKFIRFEKPYQVTIEQDDQAETEGKLPVDNEARDFQVFFKDRLEITGKTYGSRVDKNGIHFYEQQKKGRKWRYCTHLFVSKAAVENYIIGEQIGGMLVRSNAISQDDLENVLSEQQERRSKLLGEYLIGNHIVDGEDLEKVLARQKSMPNVKLGELLISEELITENQLNEALRVQKQKRKSSLGEILVEKELIDREEIQHCLANKLGIPFVNLRHFNIMPEAVKLVSADTAFSHEAMPLYVYANKLVVALEDPTDWQVIEALRVGSNKQIEPVMASRSDINWAVNFHYTSDDLAASSTSANHSEPDYDSNLFSAFELAEVTNQSVLRLVNRIIEDAHRKKVADIHIEPDAENQKVVVRFRKDGELSVYYRFPWKFGAAFASRLKTMAQLNITERKRPQVGKVDFRKFADIDLDLRVSTLPTSGSDEDLVISLLGKSRCMPVNAIGFAAHELDRVLDTISVRQGLFLITGPAGAGKTSTMHSLISYLNHPGRKICTIEGPIAIRQQGLRQIEINDGSGMGPGAALNAALNAHPDVIMVEDLRDEEAARVAVKAALSGHLVLAGLSAETATDALQRLMDLGINRLDLADSLLGIASQKLVRTLCISCKTPYRVENKELLFLAGQYCQEITRSGGAATSKESISRVVRDWEQRLRPRDGFILYKATGCKDCLDTGYRGHTAAHQVLRMSPEIRRLIVNKVSMEQIREKSMLLSMRSLKQDGLEKVLQGYTDYSQVRVL